MWEDYTPEGRRPASASVPLANEPEVADPAGAEGEAVHPLPPVALELEGELVDGEHIGHGREERVFREVPRADEEFSVLHHESIADLQLVAVVGARVLGEPGRSRGDRDDQREGLRFLPL